MDRETKEHQQRKLLFPIGVDDYKKLIENNYVYIDKTLLIQEFWEGAEVTLVTRPRRFGKTISLSMLRYFFEKSKKSTAHLFEGSQIWKQKNFRDLQGKYPVIFISFKDIKSASWSSASKEIKNILAKEVHRILSPYEKKMSNFHRKTYEILTNPQEDDVDLFKSSLLFITEVVADVLGKKDKEELPHHKTIILIDEYDTPITHAYMQGYYDEMIDFMSSLLSQGLKSNAHLHKGFMTGVVRTAKDGILSGLNNPDICTMLDNGFANKFGFIEEEIDELLALIDRPGKKQEIKSWYNGYKMAAKYASNPSLTHFSCQIYNPWSVLKYVQSSCIPETYWANTGSTDLLERLISETGHSTQDELKILLEGKSLEKKTINQDVILLDLNDKEVEPWSFLFFAGYITAIEHSFTNNKHQYTLAIPNEEIRELYKKLVIGSISKKFSSVKLENLLKALIIGDISIVNNLLADFVRTFCSYHDLQESDLERSLHLFVLGLLVALSDRYVVTSNLESGYGRYDIMLCPKSQHSSLDKGVILEFKKGKKEELDSLAKEALAQIKAKEYISQLRNSGYLGEVFLYGVSSYKKEILVKLEIAKEI